MGFFLEGMFVGSQSRDDGAITVLCSIGVDAYRIKVKSLPEAVALGDIVRINVRPNVYNGRLYFSGDFVI